MNVFSLYDIVFMYIEKNFEKSSITQNDKINAIKSISQCLYNGSTSEDLINTINSKKDKEKSPNIFFKNSNSRSNLLSPSKFYYHNELRKYPNAPNKIWDIDTGEIVNVVEEYFLEMRASYTINDIIKYISNNKDFLSKTLNDKNRATGSITFLLKKYDIDFLLFLLDTTNDIYSSKQKYAKSLIEITEYEDEAKKNYESKINECKVIGQDKVVAKKRVLFDV